MNISLAEQRLNNHRREKDDYFKYNPQSPLTPEQRTQFNGLRYYGYNPALALTVTITPFEKKDNVQIQTTKGEPRWYLRYGEFTFDVEGETTRLTVYMMPGGHYFLPFVDSSAGTETYPAGRYLELEPLGGDRYAVDFNYAYNPFCTYNDAWVCPITPAENRLKIGVRAGEKLPEGDWIQRQ